MKNIFIMSLMGVFCILNADAAVKTKNHTLTFRATSSAQVVSDQEIDVDVEFKQSI